MSATVFCVGCTDGVHPRHKPRTGIGNEVCFCTGDCKELKSRRDETKKQER